MTENRNPLRRWVILVFACAALIFTYTLFADRMTPFSGAGRVEAYVVRMAAEVPGRVIHVAVADNAIVEDGDELFSIDTTSYELAVERAEAQLERAGQSIGASTSGLDAAQANVVAAEAELAHVQLQAGRVLTLVQKGIYAKAKGDEAEAMIATAMANLKGAKANLQAAQNDLGPQGADNPAVKDAAAALEKARLDLSKTLVWAPSRGVVTSLSLNVGQVVNAGQPALTFIDAGAIWIEADMRENNLEFIDPGDPAEVVLDSRPGEVFAARVESIGWGVAGQRIDATTGLPLVNDSPGWASDPQRFPVRLVLESETPPKGVRYGARAAVTVYAQNNAIMEWLAKLRIRLVSYLTYVS